MTYDEYKKNEEEIAKRQRAADFKLRFMKKELEFDI